MTHMNLRRTTSPIRALLLVLFATGAVACLEEEASPGGADTDIGDTSDELDATTEPENDTAPEPEDTAANADTTWPDSTCGDLESLLTKSMDTVVIAQNAA